MSGQPWKAHAPGCPPARPSPWSRRAPGGGSGTRRDRLGHRLVRSPPTVSNAIAAARVKSAKVAAVRLARLLKADRLPMGWIPAEGERHLRELLAHCRRVVRTRTAVIHERHALSSKRHLAVPRSLWHRTQPVPWRPDELGGYGPPMVHDNGAFLTTFHEQSSGRDQALKALAKEDTG